MQANSIPNRDEVVTFHTRHETYLFDESFLFFFRPVFEGTGVDCAFFGNKAVLQASFRLDAGHSSAHHHPSAPQLCHQCPYCVFAVS